MGLTNKTAGSRQRRCEELEEGEITPESMVSDIPQDHLGGKVRLNKALGNRTPTCKRMNLDPSKHHI